MAGPPDRPELKRGSVIHYAYLWAREHKLGGIEGRKNRPVIAIAIAVLKESGQPGVLVVAITHSPPQRPEDAVPLPVQIQRDLGLDTEPAWVVTTEANAFTWPGPDIRPARNRRSNTSIYGQVSESFLRRIIASYLANAERRRTQIVTRTS